ncbi:hypothetical protein L195_g041921, partial [Trifolium pratense]
FSVVFESVVVIALSAHIAKEGKLNCTVNLWLKVASLTPPLFNLKCVGSRDTFWEVVDTVSRVPRFTSSGCSLHKMELLTSKAFLELWLEMESYESLPAGPRLLYENSLKAIECDCICLPFVLQNFFARLDAREAIEEEEWCCSLGFLKLGH